ncbi:MAG: DUF975 family protein [Clostridia bacterium]|nr:DUF975 family protein [Clostridia bacterium]
MPSSSEFRRRAREALRGKWPLAAVVAFLATLLGATVSTSGGSISLPDFSDSSSEESGLSPEIEQFIDQWIGVIAVILIIVLLGAAIIGLVQFILGGAVSLGYAKFNLNIVDGKEVSVSTLFSQFDRFGEGFCMKLLMNIFITLWSLLFIIPGIVKTYSYAMMPFILAENPHLSANEAITKSRQLMDGHKSELFYLDLTFIGWVLLSVFVPIVGAPLVSCYINTSRAAFYREISRFDSTLYRNPVEVPGT